MNLIPSERTWLYHIDQTLRSGKTLVVTAPVTVSPDRLLKQELWEQYWRSLALRDLAFEGTGRVGDPPRVVLQKLLQQENPVDRSSELRQGLRHRPIYGCLVVSPGDDQVGGAPQRLVSWLQQWERHLSQFPHESYPESRLRIVFVLNRADMMLAADRPMQRKVPFPVHAFPGAHEDELATLGRQLLDASPIVARLSESERSYLLLRCLDLAGGSRPDLEAAIQMAVDHARTGPAAGWLDTLCWSPSQQWVQQAIEAWQPFAFGTMRNTVHDLIDRGGMVTGALSKEMDELVYGLWTAGLWVNARGLQRSGWLTPVAMEAIKAVYHAATGTLRIKLEHLHPVVDRVASDLLNHCLIQERLLKRRFLEQVEIRDAWDEFERCLDHIETSGYSLRLQIRYRHPDPGALDLTDYVWELSLGQFLHVQAQVLGDSQSGYKPLLKARNDLAHGRPSTWSMFQAVSQFQA